MKKEIQFTLIDLQTWPRGSVFYYFSHMAPTGYSITVDMDVTKMRADLKKAGLKFFPAYLWLVTKVLNEQQEFRIADQDGQIGYYDSLTPLYAPFMRMIRHFHSVEAGKFCEKNGSIMMPLSVTCHHATTDGYHVNRFLETLQTEMKSFEQYM